MTPLNRRHWLDRSARVAAALAGLGLRPVAAQVNPPAATAWPRAAFEATTVPALQGALGLAMPQESAAVQLAAPDIAEDGASVPVSGACALPGLQRLLLLADHNPALLCALIEPGPQVEPQVSTRLKMAASGALTAVALLADGRVLFARKLVTVTLGGCGPVGVTPPSSAATPAATAPTLIRAKASGASTLVRLLMAHEMDSGRRPDGAALPVAPWFIQTVQVRLNGQPALRVHCGTAVSRNPFLQFRLRGAQVGDRLAVDWVDNRGQQRSDEALVA